MARVRLPKRKHVHPGGFSKKTLRNVRRSSRWSKLTHDELTEALKDTNHAGAKERRETAAQVALDNALTKTLKEYGYEASR